MNILVTGSSGYLGQNFINHYRTEHHFERFSLQQETLETLDLSGIEVVLHCAALVHQTETHPYETYHEINTTYPLTLAHKAQQEGVKQFLFISTIAVYNPSEPRITQETLPNPLTPYGRSKLVAEQQLLALNDEHFTVTILRIPMIYGKQAPGNIASLMRLIRKVPLLPFGGIRNQRSFIYIGNVTSVIHHAMLTRTGGTLLVADETPISTTELIRTLARGMGRPLRLMRLPLFEMLLRRLKPQMHAKLYGDLTVDSNITHVFHDYVLPYSVEEGLMESAK